MQLPSSPRDNSTHAAKITDCFCTIAVYGSILSACRQLQGSHPLGKNIFIITALLCPPRLAICTKLCYNKANLRQTKGSIHCMDTKMTSASKISAKTIIICIVACVLLVALSGGVGYMIGARPDATPEPTPEETPDTTPPSPQGEGFGAVQAKGSRCRGSCPRR